MRTTLLVAILTVTGCAGGAAPPRLLVEGHPARPWTYQVDSGDEAVGSITWYSAADLDRVVRAYVREKKVAFDFRGTEPQFWVPRERRYLADADYSSGFGKPVLHAKIGWDGHVIEHELTVAVEGTIPLPADAR